ncbi:hypothetical protein QQ020_33475 [Fulvivirgaceae bacterium BMA12]|uniref:Uncharacterized protein n=1 Tax=Agaribacillus aureus TaxID=3051825 RepID=A0ABT8LGU9_9BACT|nr:hypothetical protein [Fulvivirgaceae bacterium BMA12]
MIKKVSYIFLFSATGLLLTHSLVPHSHHAGDGQTNIQKYCSHQENNLLGLLASAFHLDLGNDHLENLKPASSQVASMAAMLVLSIVAFDLKLFTERKPNYYCYPQTSSLSNPFLLSLHSRRGPPVI